MEKWHKTVLTTVVILSACDSALPPVHTALVVEAFIEVEAPLPMIHLRETRPVDEPFSPDATAAENIAVTVWLGDQASEYVQEAEGHYGPVNTLMANALATARIEARWDGQVITGSTVIPPPLVLDSVRIQVPDTPVDGIIVGDAFIDASLTDTLRLDSLRTGAVRGLVYVIEVHAFWNSGTTVEGEYWIHTRLEHELQGSGRLDDIFLRPEALVEEAQIELDGLGRRTWTGVYAIPVEMRETPVPPHELRVAIVRSTREYAQFVAGTGDPMRREPPSNLNGGLGIIAGVSVDSIVVWVE